MIVGGGGGGGEGPGRGKCREVENIDSLDGRAMRMRYLTQYETTLVSAMLNSMLTCPHLLCFPSIYNVHVDSLMTARISMAHG